MKHLNAKAFLCALLCSCSAGTVSLGSIEDLSVNKNPTSLLLNESSEITISGGYPPYTISSENPNLWSAGATNNKFTFNYNIWEAQEYPFQIIDGIGQILNSSFTLEPSAYNFSGGSGYVTVAKDFIIDSNGDLIIAAENTDTLGITKIYLSKIKPNGQYEWSMQIGTADDTNIQRIALTSTDEIIALGYVVGDLCSALGPTCNIYGTNGPLDTFVMKISPLGTPTWTSQIGSGSFTTPVAQKITNDGNIILTGTTDGDLDTAPFNGTLYGTNGTLDTFVMKISSLGVPIWTSQFGPSISIRPTALDISAGNDIILSGTIDVGGDLHTNSIFNGTLYGISGSQDAFVMKLSSSGVPTWTSQLGGAGISSTTTVSLQLDNSDIILSGTTTDLGDLYTNPIFNGTLHGASGPIDAFVMKLSSLGIPTWTSQLGSGSTENTTPISLQLMSSEIILSGTTDGDLDTAAFNGNLYGISGSLDAFVMKLSSSGVPTWTSQLGGAGISSTTPVSLQLDNSDIILSGTTTDLGDLYTNPIFNGTLHGASGPKDAFVMKLSSLGVPTWTSQLGTTGATLITQSLSISNDFIYIFGQSSGGNLAGTSNTTLGTENAFLVKFNSDGAQQ